CMKDIQTEALIAERVLSDVAQVNGLGIESRITLAYFFCGEVIVVTTGVRCWCTVRYRRLPTRPLLSKADYTSKWRPSE
ncbi:MAG TPA: hypothetical protein VLJ39_02930, partial [Tepidisphaeraceae bacterium]|nr:hypothetical protein [Tepidisphaeraceae bacterium]